MQLLFSSQVRLHEQAESNNTKKALHKSIWRGALPKTLAHSVPKSPPQLVGAQARTYNMNDDTIIVYHIELYSFRTKHNKRASIHTFQNHFENQSCIWRNASVQVKKHKHNDKEQTVLHYKHRP
jgi:hypothetical protein